MGEPNKCTNSNSGLFVFDTRSPLVNLVKDLLSKEPVTGDHYDTCSSPVSLVKDLCSKETVICNENIIIHADRDAQSTQLVTPVPEDVVVLLKIGKPLDLDDLELITDSLQSRNITLLLKEDKKLYPVSDKFELAIQTLLQTKPKHRCEENWFKRSEYDKHTDNRFDIRKALSPKFFNVLNYLKGEHRISDVLVYDICIYIHNRKRKKSKGKFVLNPRSSAEDLFQCNVKSVGKTSRKKARCDRFAKKPFAKKSLKTKYSSSRGSSTGDDMLASSVMFSKISSKENFPEKQSRSGPINKSKRRNSLPARKQSDAFSDYSESTFNKIVSLHPLQSVGHKRLYDEMFRELREITNYPHRIPGLSQRTIYVYPGGNKKSNAKQPASHRGGRGRGRSRSSTPVPVQASEDQPGSVSLTVGNTVTSRTAGDARPGNTPQVTTGLLSLEEEQELQTRRQRAQAGDTRRSASVPQDPPRQPIPPRHPQYEDISERERSFANWPETTGQDSHTLVTYGMYFTGRFDLVRCFYCGIGLKDWTPDDQPLLEHIRNAPDCPYLLQLLGQEVLTDYRLNLIGDVNTPHVGASGASSGAARPPATHTPAAPPARRNLTTPAEDEIAANFIRNLGPIRNPAYKDVPDRMTSFERWPAHIVQTPGQLALAGFYYTGFGDVCRCFCCDGGIQRWDPQDDPFVEHARWFPQCQYIRQVKGDDFVELIQHAVNDSGPEDDDPAVVYPPPGRESELSRAMGNLSIRSDPLESPAVQSVLTIGYSRRAVLLAIHELEGKGKTDYNAEDILEFLMDKQDRGEALPSDTQLTEGAVGGATSEDPESMAKENQQLRTILKCIKCEERNTNILFMPCTHHRMCEECAEDVQICPLCGRQISQKIKTFLA